MFLVEKMVIDIVGQMHKAKKERMDITEQWDSNVQGAMLGHENKKF